MAAIFKEHKIKWQGEEVTLRATMRIINEIEQTVSLAALARRVNQGDIPLSHLATVYACLLRGAGVYVTDEDVYASMFGAGEYEEKDLITAAITALDCVFPEMPGQKSAKKKKIAT